MMKWLADNWKVFAFIALISAAVGYGKIRYRSGWDAHSAKVNTDYALKKQKAEASLVPTEQKAAEANSEGKVIYRTITRDVVKYVQNPKRSHCDFDTDAVRLRQQAIDAANNISGFDEPTMQAQSSGK